jgi:ribulose-5-phosphate 4-epimerase/fuculose-1-phosphate aldolase
MLDTICDVMKEAYKRGWISTRDGNASYRRKGENYVYVTPSGVRKQHLNSEMIIKLEIENSQNNGTKSSDNKTSDKEVKYKRVLDEESQKNNSGLNPTGELLMHLLLQSYPQESRVVLHLHRRLI